ncbi:hypothetical protein KKB44_02770 [Candidatus Micrarchaeota archaeon]|nr:hypothetical protein [Candidatus Micrarchaeota archaeon]
MRNARRTNILAAGFSAASLLFAPTDTLAGIPQHHFERPGVSYQQQILARGNCSLDISNSRISFLSNGIRYESIELAISPTTVAGEYLDMVCGENRTLIIAEERVIVTLGTEAIRRRETTLPGRREDTFSVEHDEFGSRALTWIAGDNAEYLFLINENGTLVYNDLSRMGNTFLRNNIDDLLEFPASRHTPLMRYHEGLLFIFQEGSRRLIELSFSQTGVSAATYDLSNSCPSAPVFSEIGNVLRVDFGSSTVMISISDGNSTVREL